MKRDYSLLPTTRDGKPRRPIEVVMTPMIDVIFLLLVFFLATSSFQLVEQLLPSSVSEKKESAGNAEQAPQDPTDDALDQVIVELSQPAGALIARLNGVDLTDPIELRTRFQAIQLTGVDAPVVIDPSDEVRAADVIRAYDWAREAGLSRVYLATRGEAGRN